MRLKENELVKSGVDVEKIKEEAANIEITMNPILSKYYEARKEGESKIDPEKIKESFEKFEVILENFKKKALIYLRKKSKR